MDFYIWEGESSWGVPSLDLKSLQIWTYIKFSGAPVSVHKISNPFSSPAGELPAFTCSEGIFTEFNDVTTYLRKQNYSCDYELSAKQCSEVVAYESLLIEKLSPAISYLWWVDPKNYYTVIHPWYFKNIPFPFKFWYPKRFHKKNSEYINTLYEEEFETNEHLETQLFKQAQECLTMLSHKLGEKDYFLGRTPSTLDGLVFAYLAILLKVPLKELTLQNHIKASTNLQRFVSKILQKYFPEDCGCSNNESINSKVELPNRLTSSILFGIVSFFSMLGYAITKGIVQVDSSHSTNSVDDDEEEEDDYEYSENQH